MFIAGKTLIRKKGNSIILTATSNISKISKHIHRLRQSTLGWNLIFKSIYIIRMYISRKWNKWKWSRNRNKDDPSEWSSTHCGNKFLTKLWFFVFQIQSGCVFFVVIVVFLFLICFAKPDRLSWIHFFQIVLHTKDIFNLSHVDCISRLGCCKFSNISM